MHLFRKTLALALAATALSLPALAQHGDDHGGDNHGGGQPGGFVQHNDWKKGGKIGHDDWNRGAQVDWHSHHLQQPPRGYQWRQVDGNYVLAAVATGVIATAIVASSAH